MPRRGNQASHPQEPAVCVSSLLSPCVTAAPCSIERTYGTAWDLIITSDSDDYPEDADFRAFEKAIHPWSRRHTHALSASRSDLQPPCTLNSGGGARAKCLWLTFTWGPSVRVAKPTHQERYLKRGISYCFVLGRVWEDERRTKVTVVIDMS